MRHAIPTAALALAFVAACAEAGEGEHMPPVRHELTLDECGACHLPYPPGFLPERSWRTIMATLDDHFGEDASLDEASRAEIELFLTTHAADALGRQSRLLRGIADDAVPLRISEMPWFVRKHSHEVSERARTRAGTMANCQACHRGAGRGRFEDDD